MASLIVNIFFIWFLIATIASSVDGSQRESAKSKDTNALSSNTGANRNSIEIEENRTGPYYDKSASKNITALVGKTAYLNCRVKNLGNKTMLLQVSWVRHRDIHLLTVGRYTYTSDQRFRAIHHPQTEDWILQIKYPQHRDSGVYECQVSTTPHMSHFVHLNVIEPTTEIIGAPDLYIEAGSTINLTCVILNSPEPPAYIFWNHNNAIINYDSPRGGVSVVTIKGETTTSFLLIKNARPSDSGQYQCNPSNARSKSVSVHVLNGVSHSVSRGIPSSNAARGPSSSSHVTTSLPFSLYVNMFIYFSIYYTTAFSMHKTNVTLCLIRCILTAPIFIISLVVFHLNSVINCYSKREGNTHICSTFSNKESRILRSRPKSLELDTRIQCEGASGFRSHFHDIWRGFPQLRRLYSSTRTARITHRSSRSSSLLIPESVVK